jgi:hypothetical protein
MAGTTVWPVSTNGAAVVAVRATFISGIFANFVNGSSFISWAKNALFCPLFKFSNETAAMLSPAGQDSELMPEARRTAALLPISESRAGDEEE